MSTPPANGHPRIAVVGGGMTGLTLAWFLSQRGAHVSVLEAAPELGGLSDSWTLGPVTWDRFYHVIAPADAHMIELIEALGLAPSLRWTPTRQGIFMEGAIHPLRGALDLLRLPRLGPLEKLRLGATAALARFSRASDQLDRISSARWLSQRCGPAGYAKLWSYLLRAKLGGAAEEVSARFIHATLQRLARARGAAGGGERFATVAGGYASILDRLRAALEQNGVDCRSGCPVQSVTTTPRGARVGGPQVDEEFDRVCVTVANPAVASMLPELDPRSREALAGTPYLGVACATIVGRTPLRESGGEYILNLCDPGFSITGIIDMTQVVDRERDLGGHSLVYLPRYDVHGSRSLDEDDATILATARRDLQRVHPGAGTDWEVAARVQRARWIQPLPMVGAPPVRPPRTLDGGAIHVVNNAQLATCILNNNDCVGLSREAAAQIMA